MTKKNCWATTKNGETATSSSYRWVPLDKTKYLSKMEISTDTNKILKKHDPNYILTLGLTKGKDDEEAIAMFQPFINFKEDERTIALARENYKKDMKSRRNRDYSRGNMD